MIALLLACSAPPAPEPPPSPEPAARVATVVKPAERDAARWGLARCNDGSPFAYAHRPGPTKTWVINVAGGHFCDDGRNPCAERRPRLTTTLPAADGEVVAMKSDGIFSIDPTANPDFAGAHHVDAHYCTSDLWLGEDTARRPTGGAPEGWFFAGRHAFDALLTSLEAHAGLDPTDPEVQILLMGTSAGGAGVVGNLPVVAQRWSAPIASHRVHILLDGSWVADLPSDVPVPDADHWGPVLPPCDAALAARGEDPGRCIIGSVWWPYAATYGIPILVQVAQLDTTHAAAFQIRGPEREAAWAATVRASLADVPWVWSAQRRYHVVAIDPLFGRGPEGRTLRDVVGRFWRDEPAEQVWFDR